MSQAHAPRPDLTAATSSRRQFLATSAALGIGSAIGSPAMASSFFVHGSDTIRVGLIGCGGRGTGAALDTLKADPSTRILSIGDLFADRMESADKTISERMADRYEVSDDRKHVGFDAYKKVLADPVDMVILTTPPYFRPFHFAAAIAAGKHVFFEKPVAVDPAGIRQVIAAGKQAKEKGLACVVGTQRRHNQNYLEAMQAIQDGEIGEVTAANVFWCQGGLWHHGRPEEWSDVEFQIRNWLYFIWQSGDQIIEQHIHNIDVALWAFGDQAPKEAFASGGRLVRTDEMYGNVYDHMDVTYTMPDGRKITSKCRQFPEAKANWVGEEIYGSKAMARLTENKGGYKFFDYKGNEIRSFDHEVQPYVQEHVDLVKSIRDGNPLNDAERIANTNLTAIIGRESAYSGDVVRYKWALEESELRLGPADCDTLAFESMAVTPVRIPGEYKLV
jgi:predicted dehydrogenase